ncbi:HIV-1 Tat specific factor 1 [Phyllostomus discolor]|uniref:17S U2 SnRNP complex component HTATSF1 n=1 Tax=Phyllostomus discolor TaxID=89673 RepID=A0A6J2MFI3_9CHIR|nr:HIV Tat-specific factor 1 [Phyllostomus discolor]XP_035872975.1 HIV Tat-specific factor 1 [Phyllostomus discolor]XP_035872976.1 HIV Tat-specific factor 1 [Phyllostomus discolor]XP_035872977.1 HIV Tat-specific factor 1 [Phyllostomus discolor]KAF6090614.1 HIV-1 Tat specific factor 1 [Phyllostomus discolor]
MSCSNLDGNNDFDEQLRMQELYGDTKDGDTQKDPDRETSSFGQPPDDTPYEWDLDKKAWFPKITEDFIATYQANYGFSNDGASSSTANIQDVSASPAEEPPQRNAPEPTDPKKRGEKRKAESGWFHIEEDRNTNVYVSGLPPDITVDEFIQLMSKFGIIMRDPQTEEFKVKLYKDNQGNLKGDGLCCYLKRESVDLALKLLDEDEIRGYKLHVELAKFQLKGEYDASKKKKKCKDYKKKLSQQQKQLDWRPERRDAPSRMRHERVVIIKNMFHPMDFEDDPLVLNEIREDLRVECSKFGQIKKLLLFDRHPDGVASVSFRNPEEADHCIQTLDGRWFGGRQITAQAWDGTTDYQVEETTREREERLKGWEAFLNTPEANKGLQRSNSICASERAGPSRVRHFSEHPSTSKMNAQEAPAEVEFEEPIDEKKFEKTEDGGEFEEDGKESGPPKEEEGCLQKEFEGGCLERKSEKDCPKREHEDLERQSGEGSPKIEFEEGGPKEESEMNGRGRESKKKRLKNDFEENGLEKKSEEDGPNKESGEENGPQKEFEEDESERESEEDCPEKLFENGSEKEFEENGLKKELDENGCDKEFNENVFEKELKENDSEKSEFDDDSSEKVFEEEGSEREFDKESDEKEGGEDTYEKVFDDEPDEKEDEEDADEKEEDDGDEKMFEYSDEKEDEVDAKEGEEEGIDENMFEDDSNEKLFDEDSCEKLFDDSDEKGTVGDLGNVQEEGALSTGSSFILSSDDDDDDDNDI